MAAARCMGPESFDKTKSALRINAASCFIEVWPARFMIWREGLSFFIN
jgi:hypothetical protein